MSTVKKITFKELTEALLDEERPFPARYLPHFSDLSPTERALLQKTWPDVSLVRRQALMEDLEHLGDEDDLLSFEEVCRVALQDGDPQVRIIAIRILADYEMVDFLPTFLDMAEHDPAATVRAAAAQALGPYMYMAAVDLLSESVQGNLEDRLLAIASGNDEPVVRMRALESLGYSERDELTPLIEEAYRSKNADWLSAALFAMGRSADSKWDTQVLQMLDDQRPAVRSGAATAAGELELKAAVSTLLELLDDSDSQVRLASIWALSEIGGNRVRPALTQMLKNVDDEEEAQLLEDALDNLSFNEGSGGFEFLDVGEGSDEDDEDPLYLEDEDLEEE